MNLRPEPVGVIRQTPNYILTCYYVRRSDKPWYRVTGISHDTKRNGRNRSLRITESDARFLKTCSTDSFDASIALEILG